ncbi:MAG: helix-turn-helix transcriptional regulator [Acetobacter papayae]
MKQKGVTVIELARLTNKNKSTISKALNSSSNVEAATLFDLAEALNAEWDIKLTPRAPDLGRDLQLSGTDQDIFKQSWGPVISCKSAKMQKPLTIYKTEMQSSQLETTEYVL